MGALFENLCETHQLGSATREWLVSDSAAPGFGGPHRRVVGHTEARAGYEFVRLDPSFATLLITQRGEGLVALDDAWVPCPADHAYLMPAHSAAAYRIRPGATWRLHWVIHFEPARVPGLPPGSPPRLVRCEAAGLRRAIEELCREHSGRAEPSVLGLWGSLTDRLTQRLLDPQTLDPRLDRLWARVHDDIGSPWDMHQLARAAAMSPENLRRLCVRQLGRPPMAHLAQLRMQAAAAALLHTNEKLEALAARFGYGDAFAFSTAFKRIMGRSPRQFRAKGAAARTAAK